MMRLSVHTIMGLVLLGLLSLALVACEESPGRMVGTDLPQMESGDPATLKGPADPLGNINRLPIALEEKVRMFRSDMAAHGYEVARGYWTLWDVDDCKYPLRTIGFCYGNNPVAPYAIALVPRWKDEFVDRSLHHAILAPQRNMTPTYRLDEREALVIVAEMPPPGRYFGIQTNVFTREAPFNPNDPYLSVTDGDPLIQSILFSGSPNPARRLLFSSIGNSINNVVIEQQSGQAFGEQRYFVITPDKSVAESVIAALGRVGVPSTHIFTEPVAPALVRVGLGSEADDLITYIRYAMPEDEAAGDAWRSRLPVTVLRVRDTGASAVNPFAIPEYEPRTFTRDERGELMGHLLALAEAVRARWNQPEAHVGYFFSALIRLDLIGQHCLGYPYAGRGPMNCLGDTQDADYQIGPILRLDDNAVIAVVGTLSTETGNATYTSLSVNRFPALVGVANLSDPELKGSAAGFGAFQAEDPFYVHYVARDCAGLHPCIEVSTKLVAREETMRFIQRNYLVPGSRRGPDPTKLLNPIMIILDGSVRPSAF
jgi:hypothetical protein